MNGERETDKVTVTKTILLVRQAMTARKEDSESNRQSRSWLIADHSKEGRGCQRLVGEDVS